MVKGKGYCFISISVSVIIVVMIACHTGNTGYAAESSPQTYLQGAEIQVEAAAQEQTNQSDTASSETTSVAITAETTTAETTAAETTTAETTAAETTAAETTAAETTTAETTAAETTTAETTAAETTTAETTTSAETTESDTTSADGVITPQYAITQETVISPTEKWGNNWIYDVSTPIDLYESDETTTTQIQTVAPGSSFQVTYTQDNSNLVSVMTSALSSLGTDTIDKCSDSLRVYFVLPADVDTSDLSASSFTLEGSYSLFDIEDVSQEQIDIYTLIEVDFSFRTSYGSIESMLSAWQEDTDARIILSGLSVPSSYNPGDQFCVIAMPHGMVNVKVGEITYQFEVISDPTAGDDGLSESFPDDSSADFRAHVTFQVGVTDTTAAAVEDTTAASTVVTADTTAEDTTAEAVEDTTAAAAENTVAAATEDTTTTAAEDTTAAATEDTTTTAAEDTTAAATEDTTTAAEEDTADTRNVTTDTDDLKAENTEDTASEAGTTESAVSTASYVQTGDETIAIGWPTVLILSIAALSVLCLNKKTH